MELTTRPEPRLLAYVLAAAASLVAAIVLGRAELLAVAGPFVALVAVGTADRRPPVASIGVRLDGDRVNQGDRVTGTVVVRAVGPARHDLLLVPGAGLVPAVEPGAVAGVHLDAGDDARHEVPFAVVAETWGRLGIGSVHVRSRRPWGLLVWEGRAMPDATVRALPPTARVNRLLSPADPRGPAGPHHSRARGNGTDLAELRPYRPGDRLRDLSWAATARTGSPWVTEHHPERTGTVVLLLDTMGDGGGPGGTGFDQVAGTAWSIAAAHLRAGDRVGVLASGPVVAWLPPASGRRARLVLLDGLLAVAGPTRRRPPRREDVRTLLPSDALVIGITMLQSDAFGAALVRHRRAGRTAVAIVVDPTAAGDHTDDDPLERAARQVWRAETERRRVALTRSGIASSVVEEVGEVPAALGSLTRRVARPALRRAR